MSRCMYRCGLILLIAVGLAPCWLPQRAIAAEAASGDASDGVAVATLTSESPRAPATPVDAMAAARRLDELLANEWKAAAGAPAVASASDAVFVRRASFDLIGELPTPDEITLFLLDKSPDKRAKLVERLLGNSRYGLNWGRYWRDVILARRSDERALFAAESLTTYLADAFNNSTPWNQVATDFITAKGNLGEDGRTALLASQWGEIPETAAEVARILMGVQIQCAQCHDHPTDRWKREQFHELAAFFPRIGVRPVRADGQRRGFELTAREEAPPIAKIRPAKLGKAAKRFEHYMPDLNDPAAEGTLMQPVFFVTGQQLPVGEPDSRRRETVAAWITAPENPWFARAVVNRYWAELVGMGMYEPIDDLGPDRQCTAPETLDYLGSQFIAHNYDIKWLVRTIASTSIYGRESKPRPTADEVPACGCPQPLRADQLFNSLTQALGLDGIEPLREERGGPGGPPGDPRRAMRTPRAQFQQVFGFDPSEPRDEISGGVSQALLLMNSPALARGMSLDAAGRSASPLAKLLADAGGDEEVFVELYLRCLGREPHADELAVCRRHVVRVKDRREAYEDILWALVNSTEFLYRD
ncbi:MAG: DUF1549 and DUF1553 domain-containing protein [Pirellulales bacterium]|nr:DUF1549 and DUF1553 domain-containing protein [Pirellulales bacterium]